MIAAHDVPQPIMRIPALISSLRQNSGTIGWLHGGCSDISLLIGGRLVRFGRVEEQCEHEYAPQFEMASDGTVLSVETTSGNTVYADVSVASPTAGRLYSNEITGDAGAYDGEYITGTAAAGDALAFAVIRVYMTNGCIGGGGPCVQSVQRSSRTVVVAGRRHVVIHAPALALAGGPGRLALVRPARASPRGKVVQSGDVDVYGLPRGRHVATAHVHGTIRGVAVSRDAIAVLVGKRIERFDGQGRHIGMTRVYPWATDLALSGRTIVFRTKRVVRMLDALTGRTRIAAVVTRPLLGLTISGDRIVWAERDRSSSRLVALTLHA